MLPKTNSAIDSLQLRIDLSFVSFTMEGEATLLDKYCLISKNTGQEIEDSLKHQAYKHNKKGITSRFLIRKTGHNQKEKEHSNNDSCDLEMIINSKMLKSKYSEGITKGNIRKVYNYIISLGLFTLSFQDFLKHSRCTDIDIKSDIKGFNTEKTSDFFMGLSIISPTQAISINPNKEMVFQYGFRRNEKKIINNPFVKMYHKHVELKHNSIEFYNSNLKRKYGYIDSFDNHFKDILRVEGTIKNKEHFKSMLKAIGSKYEGNSLINILDLSESELKSIISILLKKHIKVSEKVTEVEKQEDQNTHNSKLSLIEKDRLLAIKYHILEGGTIESYIYHRSVSLSRSARHRFKSKTRDLYSQFLANDNEITKKNEFRETLNSVLNMA